MTKLYDCHPDLFPLLPELLREAHRVHRRRQRVERLKRLIRRQLKAEQQSALTAQCECFA